MKITAVEAIPLRLPEVDITRADGTQDALIIRVHTDEGMVGLGEIDSSPDVAKAIVDARPSHPVARGLRSIGTIAASLELCSVSEVLTLRTCGAAVSSATKA